MSSFEQLVYVGLMRRLENHNATIRIIVLYSCFVITVFLKDENYYIEHRVYNKDIEYDWFDEREKINYITKQTIEYIMKKINKFLEEKKNEKV